MADGSNMSLTRGAVVERFITLERLAPAEGKTTYQASFSSELPVERYFGTEVLSHAADAVNMARAARGLSLLFNHDIDVPIGRAGNIRVKDGRLVGDLDFTPNDTLAQRIKADVDGGYLGDVSIRYSVDEFETKTDEHRHDTYTITRWTPLEVSIVTVPADHTVGVGRSRDMKARGTQKETETMDDENQAITGQDGGGTGTVAQITGRRAADRKAGAADALKTNQQRVETIQEMFAACRFQGPDFESLRDKCVADFKCTPETAQRQLLELINLAPEAQVEASGVRKAPDAPIRQGRDPVIVPGATADEKLSEGIQRSIEERAGIATASNEGNEFRGLTLSELARAWALRSGLRLSGMRSMQMIGEVLERGSRSSYLPTADFTGILANVASKSLLKGWEEAAATYRQVARIGNLSDFKRANRTGLSGASLLDKVAESAEYTYGKAVDRTEYLTPATYGKLINISRQAIMNDDLSALAALPRSMGRAAERTINKIFWDMVVSASGVGPTLNQDATALFEAGVHKNYDASAGGITVANVDVGRQKMRRQLDPVNGQPLNITPSLLVVPAALETTANVFVASETDPLGDTNAKGGAKQPNPFFKKLEVVAEPTLDDATNGTTAWYLMANPSMFDTFEVAFVDGQQSPYMESRNGWTVDGAEFKVRVDAAVAPLDFRGAYRKRGA